MAGGAADLITHPICTIKARLMTQGSAAGAAADAGTVTQYRGLIHGFRSVVAKEGATALFAGLGVVLIGAAPAQALFFGGMTAVQQVYTPSSAIGNFSAGIVAQLCGSISWVPMEVIKEKMMIQGQVQTAKSYSGSFHMIREVIGREGIRGVYRGFVLQQLTYGPFNGLAIMFYNKAKLMFSEEQQKSTVTHLGCSAFGYGLAAAITNPFDVVKTRRQVQMSNPKLFNYKSGLDCFQQILKNEGPLALMDGVTGRVGWLLPRCALAMTGFEFCANMLSSDDE